MDKKLYDIWRGFCRRCHDPCRKDFSKYGGHGIKVCDAWRMPMDGEPWSFSGYKEFERWALSHGYREGMTLDRISNNRGYGPDNCRWISKKAQAYNRSTNTYLTFDGRTRTLTEWAEETGIPDYAICKRLERGWSVERSLSEPLRKNKTV